jgi:hypothetical protein
MLMAALQIAPENSGQLAFDNDITLPHFTMT